MTTTAHPTVPAPAPGARRAIGHFILRFVAGWVIVIALVSWVPALEGFAVRHTIASLGQVAHLFRIPFSAAGSNLSLGTAGMEIVPDCTPLMPVASFAIAVLAFPATWTARLLGLAAGVLVLWLYNVVRILALVPVLLYRPAWFDFIHVYLWQTMTLVVVFGLFLLWLRLLAGAGPGGGAAPRPATPAP